MREVMAAGQVAVGLLEDPRSTIPIEEAFNYAEQMGKCIVNDLETSHELLSRPSTEEIR
jgi:hypothetical protein